MMLLGGIEAPTWVILTLVIAVLTYWYTTKNHGIFKNQGIPGPRAYPVIGTLAELYGQAVMETDQSFKDKYGKLVGTFEGTVPTLLVFDPDFLREAYIKNFQSFTNRRIFAMGGPSDSGILNLKGEHWKYVRSSLTPTFTQGKLKQMLPHVQKCADIFVKVLRDEGEKPVEIRPKVYCLTSDVIATTAFGIEADAQTNPDNDFRKYGHTAVNVFESADTLIEKIVLGSKFALFMYSTPWIANILFEYFGISAFNYETQKYFESITRQAINSRLSGSESGHDFVQTMANSLREAPSGDPDTLTDDHGLRWSRKGLTMNEIIGNAFLFLLAGFQTTADTMLYIFYELAMHPEIQLRLYEEIESVELTEQVTVEQINKLKYLECCVNETMRLYPQAIRIDRQATEDVVVNGVTIPKGTCVTTDAWVIQRDPELWQDPETFNPERFTPENSVGRHPCSFFPFGIGNRSCIGNRLAMLEMKVAVVQCLRAFKLEPSAETPTRPLKFQASATIAPEKPIVLKFVPRSE